jgi:hypothetical protein
MLGFEKQNLNWSFKEQIQNLPNLPNEELIWTEFFFFVGMCEGGCHIVMPIDL